MKIPVILTLILISFLLFNLIDNNDEVLVNNNIEQLYINDNLSTDTSKLNINLNDILDGGPGKDGIPSINNPKFVSIDDSEFSDDTLGILIQSDTADKFYPYNILVWHEIVNDTIDDTPISVTFCPLCGSAIVYNREIDGKILNFGVSGKLFESNLLMYDDLTESLWSQARGEAVVGEFLNTKLSVYSSDIITQGEVKKSFPNSLSLSTETGVSRDYTFYPYGDYDESERLFFPISINDKRFPSKTLMYVIPTESNSIAFVREDLMNNKTATKQDVTVVVQDDGTFRATKNGNVLPGYTEMWFSWATHHQEDGIVWSN